MRELEMRIVEDYGEIGKTRAGYSKRLTFAAWGKGAPAYDIREYSPDGVPLKGIRLDWESLMRLREVLNELAER